MCITDHECLTVDVKRSNENVLVAVVGAHDSGKSQELAAREFLGQSRAQMLSDVCVQIAASAANAKIQPTW
jgi:hypothetical protein